MKYFPRPLCNPYIVYEHAWLACNAAKGGGVAECGVYEGFVSAFLTFGLGKQDHLITQYALDTFQGFPYDGKTDEEYKKGDLAASWRVIEDLRRLGVFVHVGKIEDTLQEIEEEKFCFVFLDLDLEIPTRFAWEFFKTRLKPGARVGFHDYRSLPLPGITRICDEILEEGEFEECFRPLMHGKRDTRFMFLTRKGD